MSSFGLVITLQDDCVFSERNATEGGHRALDYIPGSVLLGAAAAQLYPKEDQATAFQLFHSGTVRFGNAYPLTQNGAETFPMPACWHEAKGKPALEEGKVNPEKTWRLDQCADHALPNNEQGEKQQPKQLRSGYVALDGSLADSRKSFRMKTAIDGKTGRAKEAMLFGYDALEAGQRFYCRVDCDYLDDTWLNKLKAVFSKPLLLGRSRSSEYGRANVVLVGVPQPASSTASGNKQITLWLQSDLMAVDEFGQPNLSPAPQDLGLPKGHLVADRSYVRTRRYSAWNAYKRGYEMERQVIGKGSVLVYQLDEALSADHIQQIQRGLGLERQAGLGQVWLNPPLLENTNHAQPVFANSIPPIIDGTSSQHNAPVGADKPDLILWLEQRKNQATGKEKVAGEARQQAKAYRDFLASARGLAGLDRRIPVGPSHSQWGVVLAAAKGHKLTELFADPEGSCKAEGEGWRDMFWHKQDENDAGQRMSFYQWLKAQCYSDQEQRQLKDARYIQHLVREIMAVLKADQRGGQ